MLRHLRDAHRRVSRCLYARFRGWPAEVAWVVVVAAAFQMPRSVAEGDLWLAVFCWAASFGAVFVFAAGVTPPEGGGWCGVLWLLAAATAPLVGGALVGWFCGDALSESEWWSLLASTAAGALAACLRVAAENRMPPVVSSPSAPGPR